MVSSPFQFEFGVIIAQLDGEIVTLILELSATEYESELSDEKKSETLMLVESTESSSRLTFTVPDSTDGGGTKLLNTTPAGTYTVYKLIYASAVYRFNNAVSQHTSETVSSGEGLFYYRTSDLALIDYWQSSNSTTTNINTDTNATSISTSGYSHSYYSKFPSNGMQYPIIVGENWTSYSRGYYEYYSWSNSSSSVVTYNNQTGNTSSSTTWYADSEELITTPSGTYSTIRMRDNWGDQVYYFDPIMGLNIREESYPWPPAMSSYSELTSSNFVPPPSVESGTVNVSLEEDSVDSTSIKVSDFFSSDSSLSYSVADSSNINVTISPSNWAIITPNSNWNGEDTITFYADDGLKTSSKSVNIKVTPANDPDIGFLTGEQLIFSLDDGPSHALLTESGELSFLPVQSDVGQLILKISVQDSSNLRYK